MSKKITGRLFEPQEFRKLNRCLSCGKACQIKKNENCDECIKANFKQCEICDIILYEGTREYYSYSIREFERGPDVRLKVSSEPVREFIYKEKPYHEKYSDIMCMGCKDWESRMKQVCFLCRGGFDNFKEHYKVNGNMCRLCAAQFQD